MARDQKTNHAAGEQHGQRQLIYTGILLTRLRGDLPDTEVWLPMGDQSTFADDEKLITALREAWRWATTAPALVDADDRGGGWLVEPC
ncbi:hypothetical protein [Amycolatopsis sp. lyj-23]|uniref:hypothetical protein n=1 Tax=Amycolatopsis sp. lyj-23 TaxID=2789283 RepID=UPI00397C5081